MADEYRSHATLINEARLLASTLKTLANWLAEPGRKSRFGGSADNELELNLLGRNERLIGPTLAQASRFAFLFVLAAATSKKAMQSSWPTPNGGICKGSTAAGDDMPIDQPGNRAEGTLPSAMKKKFVRAENLEKSMPLFHTALADRLQDPVILQDDRHA